MIFLVRHGEAASGWGDHPDPGLSDLGHKQAAAASSQLATLGANSLIASPMLRCKETAAPFAKHLDAHVPIVPAVSEIVTPGHVEDRVSWLRDLMSGEWPDEMLPWCKAAYDVVAALPYGTAVFSHFVAINAIIGQVTGKRDVLVFKPGHCSITRLEQRNGKLHLVELGAEAATRVL